MEGPRCVSEQAFAEAGGVAAADDKLRAVAQQQAQAAAAFGVQLADAVQVDHGAAMDAGEAAWGEEFLHPGESLLNQVGLPSHVDANVIAFGLQPVDGGDGDGHNAAAVLDQEPLRREVEHVFQQPADSLLTARWGTAASTATMFLAQAAMMGRILNQTIHSAMATLLRMSEYEIERE